MTLADGELAALGARLDFHECGPCGGSCCRVPWTVFVTPRDVERLEAWTGRARSDFAEVKPLPAWEREAYGKDNLLFSRVTAESGEVPQLRRAADGACVFLDREGRCGVHPAKPLLCRLFPFYYEAKPPSAAGPSPGERRAPLGRSARGRDGRAYFLLVDRGHAGMCPIPEGRIAEVEAAAGDAALRLGEEFEEEVARYAEVKDAFLAAWRDRGTR